PKLNDPYSVFATDGSQIELDTHEVALCYVINTGLVAIHYDGETSPYLGSVPELFYREDDIYEYADGDKTLISSAKFSEIRSSIEAKELSTLIFKKRQKGVPAVGLVDGTLVSWDRTASAKKDIGAFTAPLFDEVFTRCEAIKVPLAGYISGSGTSLVVNLLRSKLCSRAIMDCSKCDKNVDCRRLMDIKDTTLFEDRLGAGRGLLSFMVE